MHSSHPFPHPNLWPYSISSISSISSSSSKCFFPRLLRRLWSRATCMLQWLWAFLWSQCCNNVAIMINSDQQSVHGCSQRLWWTLPVLLQLSLALVPATMRILQMTPLRAGELRCISSFDPMSAFPPYLISKYHKLSQYNYIYTSEKQEPHTVMWGIIIYIIYIM